MRPQEIWEARTPGTWIARTALTPLSWLYSFGWGAYQSVYSLGLKTPVAPHKPIVCIGNLVVGGSGKSPLTLHVADVLEGLGHQVVVGCSGYGAPHSEAATIAPDGPLTAAEWGDEPAMFRWLRPNLPLVVGRRRVLAAALVNRQFPGSVLIMDDGFQHLPLQKSVTILIDEPYPSNERCLPAGPYREPRRNRNRASIVVPENYEVVAEPMRVVRPDGSPEQPNAYNVLCALGQPDRFLSALQEQFPNRNSSFEPLLLPDHDPLTAGNLFAPLGRDLPIVVTAKDWVKLKDRPDIHELTILVALHQVHLEPATHFEEWLEMSLNE